MGEGKEVSLWYYTLLGRWASLYLDEQNKLQNNITVFEFGLVHGSADLWICRHIIIFFFLSLISERFSMHRVSVQATSNQLSTESHEREIFSSSLLLHKQTEQSGNMNLTCTDNKKYMHMHYLSTSSIYVKKTALKDHSQSSGGYYVLMRSNAIWASRLQHVWATHRI